MMSDTNMATRSILIFADVQNSEVLGTYCHFDGYPEHMMKVLPSYDTEEKVRELLNMGDASFIESTLEASVFYARDRGEELQLNRFKIVDKNDLLNSKYVLARSGGEYVYLYIGGEWVFCRPSAISSIEFGFQF